MFKSIKEFFVGKPKVEETPAEVPYKVEAVSEPAPTPVTETVVVVETAPVVEEIKPETVFISASDNMNISISTQSDTITLTPPTDNTIWPFPVAPPVEAAVKEKRTVVKREETATKKKPAPAITATKTKPRKKK
jgi:hypothetical protein